MDLPDGWFTKGGNSYCSEPLADGAAMSHHIKGVPQAQERQEVIHINTDWRGRAKPGPWYGRYYEDWDARAPQGVGTRTGGAGPVLCGRAVGILHAGLGCGLVSRARGEDAQGRALCAARP